MPSTRTTQVSDKDLDMLPTLRDPPPGLRISVPGSRARGISSKSHLDDCFPGRVKR